MWFATLKIMLMFLYFTQSNLFSLRTKLSNKPKGKELRVKVLFLKWLINKTNSSVKGQYV